MTIRQFMLLLNRHQAAQDHELFGSAMICALLANIHKDKKKRSKPYSPADFLPQRKKPSNDLEVMDGLALLEQTKLMFGFTSAEPVSESTPSDDPTL